MIQGFPAAARGFYGDGNVFFDAFLTDLFVEAFGADAGFDAHVLIVGCAGDDSVLVFTVHSWFGARVGHCRDFAVFR